MFEHLFAESDWFPKINSPEPGYIWNVCCLQKDYSILLINISYTRFIISAGVESLEVDRILIANEYEDIFLSLRITEQS